MTGSEVFIIVTPLPCDCEGFFVHLSVCLFVCPSVPQSTRSVTYCASASRDEVSTCGAPRGHSWCRESVLYTSCSFVVWIIAVASWNACAKMSVVGSLPSGRVWTIFKIEKILCKITYSWLYYPELEQLNFFVTLDDSDSDDVFLRVNTVSDKVVRHSLASIYPCKNGSRETSRTTRKFGWNWPTCTPFKNTDFQSIFARSASSVTPGEKKFN